MEDYKFCILLLKTENDFNNIINDFILIKTWNPRAKFILKIEETLNLQQLFEFCWYHFIIDVIVIVDNDIFTYFPFENNCGNDISPKLLQKCNHEEIQNVFPEKVPKYFTNCTIKIESLNLAPLVINFAPPRKDPAKVGIEIVIVHTIIERLKTTETYEEMVGGRWGIRLSNGTFTEMYGKLQNREYDVMCGFAWADSTINQYFESTMPHLMEVANWWIPSARQMPDWKNLVMIFEFKLWISILVVLLLNSLVWWLIGRKKESSYVFREYITCLLNCWYVILQSSIKFPKTNFLRAIFILWCLTCLLLYAMYTSQLISYLTNPLYEHQITTISELLDSGMSFGFHSVIATLFNDSIPVEKEILEKRFDCSDDIYGCMNKVAFGRDFGMLSNKRTMKYYLPRNWTTSTGRKLMFEIDEYGNCAYLRLNFKKGSPLLHRFNNMILGLYENGLIYKWDDDLKYYIHNETSKSVYKPLTMKHMKPPFYILLFGLLISLFVFVIELIFPSFIKVFE